MGLETAGLALVAGGAGAYVSGLSRAEKATQGFLEQLKDAGSPAAVFGKVVTGALYEVGRAAISNLAGAAGAALKSAGDYEQSMNVFQAQSGATAEQMDAVKAKAKALGADLTLPATSAASAGNAMLELSKAGLSVDESMAAAKGTLQLAAAAQIDEASAATITANALNTFHLAGQDATRVADLLAAGANASSASVTDLAAGVQQGGFAFQAAGQKIEDLTGAVAMLTNVGLTGSDAGTALKNAMMRLMNPTDQAAKLMQQLGINVYDANGKMLPMRDIIKVLNERLGGMSDKQRNAALGTIFLSDGMKAMVPLLDAGVEGWDKMQATITKGGSAAAMAGAQMQGFNGATANLQNQLETLALEGMEPLLPLLSDIINSGAAFASGFVGKVGPAVATLVSGLRTAGDIAQRLFVPAMGAATAAAIAYALANGGQVGVALALVLQRIIATTAALGAQTVAFLAANGPLIAIGLAIGGVILAYQNLQQKVEDATNALLNSREWWTQGTDAITRYGEASDAAKEKLAPYANTIQAIQEQIKGEIKALADRQAAGTITEAQYAAEMDKINQHAGALKQATAAYEQEEGAINKAAAAQMTATNAAPALVDATAAIGNQALLSADDIAKLGEAIQKNYEKGAEAVGAYAASYSEFAAGVEQRASDHAQTIADLEAKKQQATTAEQKKGIDDQIAQANASYQTQEQNAAASYARQQQQQRQHLGQMLIDYTVNQAELGNIAKDKAAEITSALETEYGLQESSTATTYLHMAQAIDKYAGDSKGSVGSLIDELHDNETQAKQTQKAMDDYAKNYVATQTNNFTAGKSDAESYISALERIPKTVTTVVKTKYVEEGTPRGQQRVGGEVNTDGRAVGGPVQAAVPYVVGERRPEVFVPEQNGRIIPSLRQFAALVTPPRLSGSGITTPAGGGGGTVINVDARGSTLTMADVETAVRAGLRAEGRSADIRTRTGSYTGSY